MNSSHFMILLLAFTIHCRSSILPSLFRRRVFILSQL
jgi:hypothetical protein